MKIKLSGVTKESVVDGPGVRYVIFAQGCKHKCRGCHNPETHDFNSGYEIDCDEVVKDILDRKHLDGVTFSGGDPFFQPQEFRYIAEELKKKEINIMAYTGFLYEELLKDKQKNEMLKNIDIIIDGPFIQEQKSLKVSFRGSLNQRIIDVNKSITNKKTILHSLSR